MAPRSLGPGAVLIDRYRLTDLLIEFEGGRFWRATDSILARDVAVHVISSDDPRADALMEAARATAAITDPRVLRVLDCEKTESVTWVVHEWGEGLSLDRMLDDGTLSPSRAAWLVREAAQALAAGHAAGLAHGWLTPEQVLVTNAGAVKLIGYATAAALESDPPPSRYYGELSDIEADVINLAGILYSALTGRWPGVVPSRIRNAPASSTGQPMRPRQVRAGVPRALDGVCARTLQRDNPHVVPVGSAYEIEAALSDFIGDPSTVAPGSLAAMYAEPTTTLQPEAIEEMMSATPTWDSDSSLEPIEGSFPSFDSIPEPIPELEPFVDSPDRPLFASTERRVPTDLPEEPPPPPPMEEDWLFTKEPPDGRAGAGHESKQGRMASRLALFLLLMIVLVLVGVAAWQAFEAGRASASPSVSVAQFARVALSTLSIRP